MIYSISNGTAKTKLAILAFLYSGEFVKNSTIFVTNTFGYKKHI